MPPAARCRFDRTDLHRDGTSCDGRAKRQEAPALQVANGFRLPPLHAEQVGGASHVDVEESAAHQEIVPFVRDILVALVQSLRIYYPFIPPLAPPAHLFLLLSTRRPPLLHPMCFFFLLSFSLLFYFFFLLIIY